MANIRSFVNDAKERMKSGFWQDAKSELNEHLKRAELDGTDPDTVAHNLKKKRRKQIKTAKSHFNEQEYQTVASILKNECLGEVNTSPIAALLTPDFKYCTDSVQRTRLVLSAFQKFQSYKKKFLEEQGE